MTDGRYVLLVAIILSVAVPGAVEPFTFACRKQRS